MINKCRAATDRFTPQQSVRAIAGNFNPGRPNIGCLRYNIHHDLSTKLQQLEDTHYDATELKI